MSFSIRLIMDNETLARCARLTPVRVSSMRIVMNTTLRELRQLHGYATQAQLGEACGVSQSAISLIEQGRVEGRVRTLKNIAKALGVPLATVIEATTEPLSRVDDDRATPCATCGGIGALMGRWCRRCHPARCTYARADGKRCRTVGVCAVHTGAVRVVGEDRWLDALIRAGEPLEVTAAQLGRSVSAVQNRAAHLRRSEEGRGDGGRYARARRVVMVHHNGHDCPRCGLRCRRLLPLCVPCARELRGGDVADRGLLRRVNTAWRAVRVKAYQPEPGNPWAAYDACRAAVVALMGGPVDVQC